MSPHTDSRLEASPSAVLDERTSANMYSFADRHIGPRATEIDNMLTSLGMDGLGQLVDRVVPSSIRSESELKLHSGRSEFELLRELRQIGARNQPFRSYIGMGYYECFTPPVIQRNILENPAWYTQYTPYQAEIAQGRLEALLNFQTMVADLTGMEVANASLLDEGTAAAEAMAMMYAVQAKSKSSPRRERFFVSRDCHPQTIEVVRTRARSRGLEIIVSDFESLGKKEAESCFGALLQYPATDGRLYDYSEFCELGHAYGMTVAVAADLLALTLLKPPGEFGADVAIGSTQRLGMPIGCGGPHAAYFATGTQFARHVPGRIIGVSSDALGNRALRMALQTREQHIRRERATSNICTAEVLPAVVVSMYAVYHGPQGLYQIGTAVAEKAAVIGRSVAHSSTLQLVHDAYFDTVCIEADEGVLAAIAARAVAAKVNLRRLGENTDRIAISLDETTNASELTQLLQILDISDVGTASNGNAAWPSAWNRTTSYLEHSVFNSYHSETEILRYMRRLDARDLSLTTSMIPLGSCTMKLNATVEMMPITWPEFSATHPFAPIEQMEGYQQIVSELTEMLKEITGMAAVSLQPNSGAQGEYSGLLSITRYHESRGDAQRKICLVPSSAHGTNPASAVMAGLRVVVVSCDEAGNIDVENLRAKATAHRDELAALMVTYPSTHGVFEEEITNICAIVHEHGGQVYMDGANMNALVGVCRPRDIGIDVCHLNLHKTFCIPHGGGGPGMGPIAVASHLADWLPGHPCQDIDSTGGPVSSAPWGSTLILLISWAYIRLMGGVGLQKATAVALLNANYVAHRLKDHFPILYTGRNGLVAHEAILDLRAFKDVGLDVDDVAKRLMDYGFHAPTVHFPVAGTMMVEPTESESQKELDRFCDVMIAIRNEIAQIERAEADPTNNVLKNAPHCLVEILSERWSHPYSREKAVMPAPWLSEHKFWPHVARVDNAAGDRNLMCTCPPMDS